MSHERGCRDEILDVQRVDVWGAMRPVVSVACHDLRVDRFGTAVVVTGVQHAVLRMSNDARFEDFTMMTNVFELREGRWVMVLAHALSLPM